MGASAESRTNILDAATELLEESGADFSVGAVAERAGVSRTTVYRHFGDRGGLLAAVEGCHGVDTGEASSRERILNAVGRLLPDRTMSDITVEEVAEQAGVAPVTVYRHFEHRLGLFQAWAGERGPRHDADKLLTDHEGDPEETLVRFVTRLVSFMRTHRARVLEALNPDEDTRAFMAELRQGDKRTQRAVMAFMAAQQAGGRVRGTDPGEPALALFSLVLGFAVLRPIRVRTPSTRGVSAERALAEQIVGVFWSGFRP